MKCKKIFGALVNIFTFMLLNTICIGGNNKNADFKLPQLRLCAMQPRNLYAPSCKPPQNVLYCFMYNDIYCGVNNVLKKCS